jgi:uncharacterized protein (TIGR00255 family)
MTGYGVAEGPVSGGVLAVEVRTVNHRHFTPTLKLGGSLQQFESVVRDCLRVSIARGHVTLSARWVEEPERPLEIRVNVDRGREVMRALTELKQGLDLPGDVDLAFVARQPEVLTTAAGDVPDVAEKDVLAVVTGAVHELVAVREREGAALGAELAYQLGELEKGLEVVEERAPQRLVIERDRLKLAVEELLDGRAIDEQRLSQELAILADKLDITEEIVRLRTHIAAARDALSGSGPVGRHLSFLGQEILREVNTIGSKGNDAEIAQAVIGMKGVVEKIREQVENLE